MSKRAGWLLSYLVSQEEKIMRKIIWVGLALGFWSWSTPSLGESTCTAPGHPNCTITCPAWGCIALYFEPDGPCRTMCSGVAGRRPKSSVEAKGAINSQIRGLLPRRWTSDQAGPKREPGDAGGEARGGGGLAVIPCNRRKRWREQISAHVAALIRATLGAAVIPLRGWGQGAPHQHPTPSAVDVLRTPRGRQPCAAARWSRPWNGRDGNRCGRKAATSNSNNRRAAHALARPLAHLFRRREPAAASPREVDALEVAQQRVDRRGDLAAVNHGRVGGAIRPRRANQLLD